MTAHFPRLQSNLAGIELVLEAQIRPKIIVVIILNILVNQA